jgi:hypothetical protein
VSVSVRGEPRGRSEFAVTNARTGVTVDCAVEASNTMKLFLISDEDSEQIRQTFADARKNRRQDYTWQPSIRDTGCVALDRSDNVNKKLRNFSSFKQIGS